MCCRNTNSLAVFLVLAVLTCWALACTSCSNPPAGFGSDADADVHDDAVDSKDQEGDVPGEDGDTPKVDELDEKTEPDETAVEPDACECLPICKEGDFQCKMAGKKIVVCEQNPEDPCKCWKWSAMQECPTGQKCTEDEGCACEFGACESGDTLSEVCGGKPLEQCESWICQDGCCATAVDEECCLSVQDPVDCIDLSTGETVDCTDPLPDGVVKNLCTLDVCEDGKCKHFPMDPNDGDPCTLDTCEPLTGFPVNTPMYDDEKCILTPCWGKEGAEADGMCNDDNLCTAEACKYVDGFIAWEEALPPNLIGEDLKLLPLDEWPANVGHCVFIDKEEMGECDDKNPCFDDDCDPMVGCTHAYNPNAEGCEQCDPFKPVEEECP
ncbi:MAG: hypothetical protein FJ109_21590, partial [Deltaproteobacteria bacterium]|nr:hypothetical protein [Deltaproteobacteria bacterium]